MLSSSQASRYLIHIYEFIVAEKKIWKVYDQYLMVSINRMSLNTQLLF